MAEEFNQEEVTEDVADDVVVDDQDPTAKIVEFGTFIQDKIPAVQDGSLSPEEFIENCIARLEELKTEIGGAEANNVLGGLGGDAGSFFDVDSEDRDA